MENISQVKELFDMVYQWGRVGIVVDFRSPAFQKVIKKIKNSQYLCPIDIHSAPEPGEECPICGIVVD
jgi:hypothetical protein